MTTLDASAGSEKTLSFLHEISLTFSSMRADVSQETSFVVSACDEGKHYINSVRALEILCVCICGIYTDCNENLGSAYRFLSGLLNREPGYSSGCDHLQNLGRKLLSCESRQGKQESTSVI